MCLWSHYVAETRPPLPNVVASCRGGSGSIQNFIATVAPMYKTPRATRIIFGEMGVILRHSAIIWEEIGKKLKT